MKVTIALMAAALFGMVGWADAGLMPQGLFEKRGMEPGGKKAESFFISKPPIHK
jgi:hypothetical protein